MEVNKNTARRVSHGAADNDSIILRCYAMTNGKVTYPSANIYQPKTHNILEDPNRHRTPSSR
jgi:alpha-mannosidase